MLREVGQLLGAPRPPAQPCAFRGEWESGQPSKRLVYEAKAKVAAASSFNCLQGTAPFALEGQDMEGQNDEQATVCLQAP